MMLLSSLKSFSHAIKHHPSIIGLSIHFNIVYKSDNNEDSDLHYTVMKRKKLEIFHFEIAFFPFSNYWFHYLFNLLLNINLKNTYSNCLFNWRILSPIFHKKTSCLRLAEHPLFPSQKLKLVGSWRSLGYGKYISTI